MEDDDENVLEDLLGQLDIVASPRGPGGSMMDDGSVAAAAAPMSDAEREKELNELEEMRSLGLVSPAEYDLQQRVLKKGNISKGELDNMVDDLLNELTWLCAQPISFYIKTKSSHTV